MQHLCHAIGCSNRVPPKFLMCGPHWFMVPIMIRRDVWRWYKPGQEDNLNPRQEWIDAAKKAINHVAQLEGKQPLPEDVVLIKTVEDAIAKAKLNQGEEDGSGS